MLHRSTRPARPGRRGGIVIILALCIIGLLGVVAVATDGGVLQDEHRKVQAAADAAAFAAAVDLYENYVANTGTDPGHTARDSALNTANQIGYNNDGTH